MLFIYIKKEKVIKSIQQKEKKAMFLKLIYLYPLAFSEWVWSVRNYINYISINIQIQYIYIYIYTYRYIHIYVTKFESMVCIIHSDIYWNVHQKWRMHEKRGVRVQQVNDVVPGLLQFLAL